MKMRIILIAVVALAQVPAWTNCVLASQADDAKSEVHRVWDIDAMMAQAAYNIGRRYNLNEEQQRITRDMLTEQVTKFFDTHPEIWPVLRDLTRLQLEGKAPNEEVARRLGEAALPLLLDAQEAILDGNARWREILTPEQKRLHDYDLKDMDKTFSKMLSNFNAMASGKPTKPRLFPEKREHPNQPPRPSKPSKNYNPPNVMPDVILPREDAWERYVRTFITDYELDNAQSEVCWSILRECKARAAAYKNTKEKGFRQAAQLLREARSPDNPDIIQRLKIKRWSQMDKELREPLERVFVDLQTRLDRIPTDAQRRKVASDAEKRTRWSMLRKQRAKHSSGETTQDASANRTESEVSAPKADDDNDGARSSDAKSGQDDDSGDSR